MHLFGKHNIQNCLAAALLTYCAGASIDVIRRVLTEFRGVEHRLEWVRDVNGVPYYNDSKGTHWKPFRDTLFSLPEDMIR